MPIRKRNTAEPVWHTFSFSEDPNNPEMVQLVLASGRALQKHRNHKIGKLAKAAKRNYLEDAEEVRAELVSEHAIGFRNVTVTDAEGKERPIRDGKDLVHELNSPEVDSSTRDAYLDEIVEVLEDHSKLNEARIPESSA